MLKPVDKNILASLTGNRKRKQKKKESVFQCMHFLYHLKWCRKVFIHSINPILIILTKLESFKWMDQSKKY